MKKLITENGEEYFFKLRKELRESKIKDIIDK